MAEYVLDAALVHKWFLPTAQGLWVPESRVLLDRIARGSDVAHVPVTFHSEFAAWLAARGNDRNIDVEKAWEAVRALPLREHPLTRELASNAFLSARRLQVDFYTATYIALAESLICPFVTADEALAARLSGQTRITTPAVTR
jgi:predicted nucleic acid-binding protein